MSKSLPRIVKFAVSATALASLTLSAASAADTLRVCSDPDNLPFSKSEGADKGLYIELAELVGKRLGTPVEYVWWLSFNQRRALRTTMDGCDAYFALPADAQYRVRGLVKSNAFLSVSYAIVAPQGLKITALSDLKGKKNRRAARFSSTDFVGNPRGFHRQHIPVSGRGFCGSPKQRN